MIAVWEGEDLTMGKSYTDRCTQVLMFPLSSCYIQYAQIQWRIGSQEEIHLYSMKSGFNATREEVLRREWRNKTKKWSTLITQRRDNEITRFHFVISTPLMSVMVSSLLADKSLSMQGWI